MRESDLIFCDLCKMEFSHRQGLHRHKQNMHIKKEYHKCEKCEILVSNKANLKAHMKTHKNIKSTRYYGSIYFFFNYWIKEVEYEVHGNNFLKRNAISIHIILVNQINNIFCPVPSGFNQCTKKLHPSVTLAYLSTGNSRVQELVALLAAILNIISLK